MIRPFDISITVDSARFVRAMRKVCYMLHRASGRAPMTALAATFGPRYEWGWS